MKAAIVEQPGLLRVREIPEPEMGPYDALCRMLYGSVCTGTDRHIVDGNFAFPVSYPTVLGHESIGRVEAVGSRVRAFEIGDIVTQAGLLPIARDGLGVTWGGFVEWGIARDYGAMREDGQPIGPQFIPTHRIVPPELDPAAATMLITWRETLSYVTRMGVRAGAHVLIVGSGGVGVAFAVHATNRGAATIAMLGNPERRALALRAGVTGYVDYRSDDPAEQLATCGPFDHIIDAVGKQGIIDDLLPLLRPGGMLGVYGVDDLRSYRIDPFRARGTFSIYNGGYDQGEAHDEAIRLMQQGKLDASLWLDLERPTPLDQIEDAFVALQQRATLKAVIRLQQAG